MKKYFFTLALTIFFLPVSVAFASGDAEYPIANLVLTADGVSGCNLKGNSKLVRASWDMNGTASDYIFDTTKPGVTSPDYSSPGNTSRYLWDTDGSPIAGVWKFQVHDYPDTGLKSKVCTYTWEDLDGTGAHGITTISLDNQEAEPGDDPVTTEEQQDADTTNSIDNGDETSGDNSEDREIPVDLETRLESEVSDIGTALFVIAGVCSLLTLGFVALVVFLVARSRKSRSDSTGIKV